MTINDVVAWPWGGWKKSKHAVYRTDIGHGIDVDGNYGFQCVDWSAAYAEFLGHPFNWGNAEALWTWKQDAWWKKVSSPKPGDVHVMWYSSGGVEYGHTGIVIEVTSTGFYSIDQNWINSSLKVGSPPAKVFHPFNNKVRGFLRPSIGDNNMITKEDKAAVRIVMSEVEGWNGHEVHSGKHDTQIMGAWTGKTWPEMIWHCWNVQKAHRIHLEDALRAREAKTREMQVIIDSLSERPTKEEYAKAQAQINDCIAEVQKLELERTEDSKLLEEGKPLFTWITKLIERLKR